MRPENPLASNKPTITLNGLPDLRKIVIIILTILAISIIVFWIWQMQTQINSPFADNSTSKLSSSVIASTSPINLLKETDTDGDGLSDYAEIYIYHTSPYLVDSDSDGISDFKEVQQGTNPNCPQGKNCNISNPVVNSNPALNSKASQLKPTSSISSLNSSPSSLANSSSTEASQVLLQKVLNGQANAQMLREILISQGISTKAQLDKISDSELMNSYQTTLHNQSSSTSLTK